MNKAGLDTWTKSLGMAWVNKDVDAALSLVDKQNVIWYESPLEEPLVSWDDIYSVWQKDLSGQKDISFSHEVLACDDKQGLIRWKATLTKIDTNKTVKMDGIFLVSLNDKNLCTNFTMWTDSKDS